MSVGVKVDKQSERLSWITPALSSPTSDSHLSHRSVCSLGLNQHRANPHHLDPLLVPPRAFCLVLLPAWGMRTVAVLGQGSWGWWDVPTVQQVEPEQVLRMSFVARGQQLLCGCAGDQSGDALVAESVPLFEVTRLHFWDVEPFPHNCTQLAQELWVSSCSGQHCHDGLGQLRLPLRHSVVA